MLRIVSIDYKKYPFLADVNEILSRRWPALSILDLIRLKSGAIYERAVDIVKSVVEKGIVKPRWNITTEEEIVAFYSAIILVSILNNRWLRERFSIAFAKYAYNYLKEENGFTIEAIARKLGISMKYDENNCPRIPLLKKKVVVYKIMPYCFEIKDFLKYTKRLSNDPKYALVNQIVEGGKVYVDKDVAIRVLEEAISQYISSLIKPLEEYPKELNDIVSELRSLLEEKGFGGLDKASEKYTSISIREGVENVIDFDAFPPCMSKLVNELKRGENLSHHARFTVAAFLSRIGMSVDDILELFKNAPDFNEKIARYQIEHISGLRGSRKQYMPYSCSTMKSLGLCPLIDHDCNAKNPLVVYRRNLYRKRTNVRKKEDKGKHENQ